MKNHIRNFIFMIGTILLFGASSAGAVPVELKFTGLSGMYDGAYQFSGSILYETDAFVTDTYDVALATDDSYPPFYAGNSSYIQSMQSNSLFRLESSNWEGFDIESFNTASNFVNSISISTGFEDGPPRSTITFVSFSDQYSLVVENVHMEVHAVAYAADKKIYDIPTSATPFWPDFTDYSEYYYTFREVDFEDAGGLNGLTPVPEPGTVLLLGAGLAALVAFGKRQRVQARKVVYPPRA